MKKLHTICWDLYQESMNNAVHRVAVDAGANDGGYTHTLVENGFRVHAFEPVPRMYEQMVAKHGTNPNVFCHNLGLSDHSETFKDVTVLSAWTIGKPGMGGLGVNAAYQNERFDMTVVPLDSVLDHYPEHRIGIFKLDVDGYEYRVLKGARKMIQRDRPPILCEFGCYIAAVGDNPEEFVNYIFNMGYDVVSLDGKSVYRSWAEVKPEYPFTTTFDVMLMPR